MRYGELFQVNSTNTPGELVFINYDLLILPRDNNFWGHGFFAVTVSNF